MCLITEKTKPVKIRKDKIVYKELDKVDDETFRSTSQFFLYTLGECFKTDFNILSASHDDAISCDDITDEVYGSLPDRREAPEECEHLICITKGFHSVKTIKRMSDWTSFHPAVIVECIIPKGSLVYEDSTGLLASNMIIINKIVK